MIRFFHFNGHGQIQFKVDSKIEVTIEGDKTLLSVINQELDRGIPILKEFKQKGIPGKVKSHKNISSVEDLVSFLKHFRNKFPNMGLKYTKSMMIKNVT